MPIIIIKMRRLPKTLLLTLLFLQNPTPGFASNFNCYCNAVVDDAVVKSLDNLGRYDSSNHRGSCELACRDAINQKITDWCELASVGGRKQEKYSIDNKKWKKVDLGYYSCINKAPTTPTLDFGCNWIVTPTNPQFIPTNANAATCPTSLNTFPYIAYCIHPQFIDQCYGWSPTQRSTMMNVVCPGNHKIVSGTPNNLADTCVAPTIAATLPASVTALATAPDDFMSGKKAHPSPTPASTPLPAPTVKPTPSLAPPHKQPTTTTPTTTTAPATSAAPTGATQ